LFILAPRIIPFLFGDEFLQAVPALKILAWRIVIASVSQPLSFALISLNQEKKMALIVGGAAVINVVLNFLLIPGFGLSGAAIATITSGVIIYVGYIIVSLRTFNPGTTLKYVYKPILASLPMSALAYFGNSFNLLVLILMCVVVYGIAVWLLRTVTPDDLNQIKSALGRM